MKFTFLGTAAAEGYPANWCTCPHCDYARKHGGRNLRVNSSAIVDDAILLDMNNATFDQLARYGVSPEGIFAALITHPHEDHFVPNALEWRPETLPADTKGPRADGGFDFRPARKLTMAGNAFTQEKLRMLFPHRERFNMEYRCMLPGDKLELEGYIITAVRGNHGAPGFSTTWLIEKDGKRVLYATDSGGYEEDMFELLSGCVLDLFVMEGTGGERELGRSHMNLKKNIAMRKDMLRRGLITQSTPVAITHMSPHWTAPHDTYEKVLSDEGMICAYDGLTIEF